MAATIPLHCDICPKKPNFSDVSHLLTHIASKGHLSNYYKVKVRSGSEEASRRLIDAYDRWYAEWSVEDLMSERMSQKDKRRTRARPAGTSSLSLSLSLHPSPRKTFANSDFAAATRVSQPAPKIEAPAPRSMRPRAAVSNLLDPRLSEHHMTIKVEHSMTPTPPPHPGPVLRQRAIPSRMQYWPVGSRSTSQSYTNPDYETSSEYSEPCVRRPRYPYNTEDSCAVVDDDDVMDEPVNTLDPTAASECTKLKGVYWPGMDLFDSATPEMRRKRNQKKDISVVEQLEVNSREVDATELIFTPQGTFKKQRRISSSECDDEEDSPVRGDSPRPYLTRPALANLDVNVRRRSRQTNRSLPFPYATRSQYNNDQGRSEYDFLDRAPARKKRAFEVFPDDEISFAQPAAFNYLTAGYHRHQASPTPAPAQPLPAYKTYNDFYPHESKENIMPAYHQPVLDHHPHHHHRQPSGFHYHTYAYGLGHDQHAFQYQNHLYMNNAYYQQSPDDADDQRTVTAPPSPSTT
jgi:hypothetical protein